MNKRIDVQTAGAPGLKRAISLPQLIFYGLGTMVGGGIYALLGEVGGAAGMGAPVAFLVAGLLAVVNALTFAELSSRMPFSAGEAHYTYEAFRRQWLSGVMGWLVIATGVISAGLLSVATIRFLGDLIQVPHALGITLLVLALGAVAAWGIGESVAVVVVITVIEVAALVYVIVAAGGHLSDLPERYPEILAGFTPALWMSTMTGALLGFYAFVGFEDMVNMAEEVKAVRRTMPIGIFVSVAITSLLYLAVSLVAVLAVAPAELAAANTPLAAVLGGTEGISGKLLVVVGVLAGINGALVQIIMAARVAYGMAGKGSSPAFCGKVHPKTQTPLFGTVGMTVIVLVLALFFPLVTLAKATSLIMLVVFALLNLALWRIKRRGDPVPEGARTFPIWIPPVALAACLCMLISQVWALVFPSLNIP